MSRQILSQGRKDNPYYSEYRKMLKSHTCIFGRDVHSISESDKAEAGSKTRSELLVFLLRA